MKKNLKSDQFFLEHLYEFCKNILIKLAFNSVGNVDQQLSLLESAQTICSIENMNLYGKLNSEQSLLYYAVLLDNGPLVKVLLNHSKISFHIKGENSDSIFIHAIINHSFEALSALLQHEKTHSNKLVLHAQENNTLNSPLILLTISEHPDSFTALKELLTLDIPLNERNRTGNNALMEALLRRDSKKFDLLWQYTCQCPNAIEILTQVNSHGMDLFLIALSKKLHDISEKILKIILLKTTQEKIKSLLNFYQTQSIDLLSIILFQYSNFTLLSEVLIIAPQLLKEKDKLNKNLLIQCLEHNIEDKNIPKEFQTNEMLYEMDNKKNTALSLAIQLRKYSLVIQWIQMGLDLSKDTELGNAFVLSCQRNNLEFMRLFARQGMNLYSLTKEGYSALYLLLHQSNAEESLKFLLQEQSFDPNYLILKENNDNNTGLLKLLRTPIPEANLEILLSCSNLSVNMFNEKQETPLALCAIRRTPELLKRLLEQHDVCITLNNVHAFVDIAIQNNNACTLKFFLDHLLIHAPSLLTDTFQNEFNVLEKLINSSKESINVLALALIQNNLPIATDNIELESLMHLTARYTQDD